MVRRLALLSIAAIAAGQTSAPTLKFEVASVKPVQVPRPGVRAFVFAGASSQLQISGTRVTTRGSLTMLTALAYNLERFQVTQGTEFAETWANDVPYDVEARAPGDSIPTSAQVRQMMRALLAERFHLKFARQTKVTPVYDLVIASGVPKLQPTAFADSAPNARSEGASGAQIRTRFLNVSIADFAARIRGQFDRPLLDKTGLDGGFDFSLAYRWQAPGMTVEATQAMGLPDPEPGMPIVASIREQLGLRLVAANEPIETLLIVHAERPSAN
jgi:uncharacterized protein (TIGR03435 family)